MKIHVLFKSLIIISLNLAIFWGCSKKTESNQYEDLFIEFENKLLCGEFNVAEELLLNYSEINKEQLQYFELKKKLNLIRLNSFRSRLSNTVFNIDSILVDLISLEKKFIELNNSGLLGDYFAIVSSFNFRKKNFKLAEKYNLLALQKFQEIYDLKKVAQINSSVLSRIHLKYEANGNLDSVMNLIPKYESEINFSEKVDNKYVESFNTRHLAQIYLKHTNQFDKAKNLFSESLALREEIKFNIFLPPSYSSLGDVEQKLGNFNNAEKFYLKALSVADSVGFVRHQVIPLLKLGELKLNSKNYKLAYDYFDKAHNRSVELGFEYGIKEAKKKLIRKGE